MPTPNDEPTQPHPPEPETPTASHVKLESPTANFAGRLEQFAADTDGPPTPPLAATPDATIPGFEIVGELGRGAMGVVYEAKQAGLNRTVALKMVIAGPYSSPSTRARFLIEAEAVAALEHPHIVRVFAFGEHGGHPFLAMEHLSGGTLSERIRKGGPPPGREAAAFAAKLAEGVAHAHARGVVHRDIKPGNVLLTADGEPRLTDFGLAKVGRSDMTATGAILGTPAYMSPEQAAGKTHEVGTHSDVYALGAVLYDLLTGRPPFRGDSQAATLQLVLTAEPGRPRSLNPSVPRDLETICLKCLEKQPAKRYATAQAVADDLNRFLMGEPIHARPTGTVERVVKWVSRNKGLTAAMTAVVLALLTGTALALWQADKAWEAEAAERIRSQELSRAEQAEKLRSGQLADALGKVTRAESDAQQKASDLAGQLKESRRLRDIGSLREASLALGNNLVQVARDTLNEVSPENRGAAWGLVNRRLEGSLLTFHAASETVSKVALSRDGSRLATVAGGAVVQVWDGRTGELLRELRGHSDTIWGLAMTDDGSRVVTGSKDKTARVWDLRTGQTIARLKGHSTAVLDVAISADGSRVATAPVDRTASVWDVRTGRMLQELKGHTAQLSSVAISADGSRIATGSYDGTARIWDAATGQTRVELRGHHRNVTGMAMNAEGTLLVTTGDQRASARVWDVATGAPVSDISWTMNAGYSTPARLSADGSRVVVGSSDGMARLWDSRSGQLLLELKGHTGRIDSVAISADGSRVATGAADGTARIWDAVTGRPTPALGLGPVAGWGVLSRDGSRVLGVSRTGTSVWDTRSGSVLRELGGLLQSAWCGALSDDGSRAVVGVGVTARVWDLRTGRQLSEFPGHAEKVAAAAISGRAERVATIDGDGAVRFWDVASGSLVGQGKIPRSPLFALAMTSDGSLAATGSDDEVVRIWETKTGTVLTELRGHTGAVVSAAITLDGSRVVTGSRDGTARVWDVRASRVVSELKGHSGAVLGVAIVADGSTVLTASSDQPTRVWDANTGQLMAELARHAKFGAGVAVSADGTRVVTSSLYGTWLVWDTPTRHPVLELLKPLRPIEHGGNVLHSPAGAVAVSPDGARVVVGCDDKVARVWDIETGKLVHELRGHTGVIIGVGFDLKGDRIGTFALGREARVWDAATGRNLSGVPVPELADVTDRTPDGRYVVRQVRGRVYRLSTSVEADELRHRLWATRPDPAWHAKRAVELAKEGNAYGAAVQRAAERRAMGVVAFDFGDLEKAHAHFLEAALLAPQIPKAIEIVPQKPAPGRIPPATP